MKLFPRKSQTTAPKQKKQLELDENGEIKNRFMAWKIERKAERIYVRRKVAEARVEVKRFELYKERINELNIALDQGNAERAMDIKRKLGLIVD